MPKTAKKHAKKRMSLDFPRNHSPVGKDKENPDAAAPVKPLAPAAPAPAPKAALAPANASSLYDSVAESVAGVTESVAAALSPKAPKAKKVPARSPGLPTGSCKAKVVDIDISESALAPPAAEGDETVEGTPLSPAMRKFLTNFEPPTPKSTDATYRDAHAEVQNAAAWNACPPLVRDHMVGLPIDDEEPAAARPAASRLRERCACFPLWRL